MTKDGMAVGEYRVLILAPTGEDGTVLRDVLAREKMTPYVCRGMEHLCEEIGKGAGTAIIAEEAITAAGIGRLAQEIGKQPEWSDFPLIIMAGAGTDPDRTWAVLSDAVQLLNANVLDRPVLTRTLLAAVRTSLRSRDTQYRVAEELRLRRQAEASLTAAYEEMQAFSYSVSHDLRAPLRAMRGFSTFLLEDYSDSLDETGRDYLNRIVNSADHMNRLIEDMLNLSKVSRQEMMIENVDLSSLARAIIEELRGAEPSREVEVVIEENLSTSGDERLLRIALDNLLGNAWKYSSKVHNPRIEFGCFTRDEQRVFFVRDNGAGFSMANVGKLFTPFQRLHTEGQFPGTGIGLPIVHRVIGRHGGSIWAEGEPGKGASFYFTLPRETDRYSPR